jgi:hypothetical protein
VDSRNWPDCTVFVCCNASLSDCKQFGEPVRELQQVRLSGADLVNLLQAGLLTWVWISGKADPLQRPKGTLSNSGTRGQNGCSIFAILEIKQKSLG